MPTTPSTINYYIAADGTLRDGQAGSIAQTPRIYYGTEYAVTLSFPPSTIAEGDQLQVAVNRSRTFFSSASATGDAPVAAVAKHEVTAAEADAQAVTLTLSTNTRAMIDQVNGIDHPVRGFFGVHILKGQSFVTLAVADAFMLSVESGPDAISPSLPVVNYPTREEAEALTDRSEAAAERAEQAAAGIVPPLQLSAPPTTSTAGSVGQLAVYHDTETNTDHLYHLCFVSEGESATLYHWEECVLESQRNVANGFAGLDGNAVVPINQLPTATNITKGIVNAHTDGFYGIKISSGMLLVDKASNAEINERAQGYKPIVPNTLNYAVRSVLPLVTEIPAATSDYSLVDSSATTLNHSHTFVHTPSQAPTYRLPSVSGTTVSHYIELTVDFTNVQTYSFLDSNGDALVPLFTPAIAAGDVYTFKMEYSAIKAKWLIYPQKQGAVADDFVMRGEVGAANGVAGLNSDGVVPQEQLNKAQNSSGKYGVVKIGALSNAVGIDGSYNLYVISANDNNITSRQSKYLPITPAYLNYAVTAALTDNHKISLTDAQKAAAQEVFGIGGPITEIPAATSEYTLSEGIFKHAPANAPTYNLPSITDTIRSHVIVIAIDFSSVQTFSFVPPQDSGVTFQSYANPNMGDVWVFRCVWYGGKWRIAPMKIKNCVTRQLTSGALAITDAVTGDALALKMTAPRSVVVNQRVPNGQFNNNTISGWDAVQSTLSASDGVLTVTQTGQRGGCFAYVSTWDDTHVYMCSVEARSDTYTGNLQFGTWKKEIATTDLTSNWSMYFSKITTPLAGSTSGALNRLQFFLASSSETFQLRNPQLVDLTQYFNGDSTLIDSIQTWADLVAYDPRFAQYVEYNTGTVAGVQPSVQVTGKNLFDKTQTLTNGFYNDQNIFTSSNNWRTTSLIPVKAGSTITGTYPSYGGDGPSLRMFDVDQNYIGLIKHAIISGTYKTYVLDAGCCFVQDCFKVEDLNTYQLELGSTATSYEPYHDGGTATAPSELFAVEKVMPASQTRTLFYDEYEAVLGGIKHNIGILDLGSKTWTYDNVNYCYLSSGLPSGMKAPSIAIYYNFLADKYIPKPASTANVPREHGDIWIAANNIYVKLDSTEPSPTGMFYYELATPTTSQFTPAQISLQAGDNTAMQTDGGRLAPIDITYESNEI